MIYPMEQTEKIEAGTAAKEVSTGFRAFLLKNMSDSATVYFRECYGDGLACTANNSFALGPGETTPVPLRAGKLSILATATAEARLLYIGEGW